MPTKRKKTEIPSLLTVLTLLSALVLTLAPLPTQATQMVLLYSNDNVGEIEPCG